jgi:phytoene dehydrogenase-like protein
VSAPVIENCEPNFHRVGSRNSKLRLYLRHGRLAEFPADASACGARAEAAHRALGEVLQDYLAVAEKEAESPTTADSIKCLRETLASFPK